MTEQDPNITIDALLYKNKQLELELARNQFKEEEVEYKAKIELYQDFVDLLIETLINIKKF